MKKISPEFYSIAGLFFFWGFVAASNDVLIPVFKDHLHIQQWQSQLISFVFYGAYTFGSIVYIGISYFLKTDLLQKIGFSKGLSIGLLVSFAGTLLFIPAAQHSSFTALISGLFIIGLGFSLQQTAANPLVIAAGDASYGSQRLSMAGGINNIGTTIGPLLVSYAVFQGSSQIDHLNDLMYPYLLIGLFFLFIALVFFRKKQSPLSIPPTCIISADYFQQMYALIKKTKVRMAMLAIFLYVGVEVSTASNLAEFAKHKASIPTSEIAPYISLYWASLMIGRWASASDIFAHTKIKKWIFKILFSLAALLLFYGILRIHHPPVSNIQWMLAYIFVLWLLDILSDGDAAKQLLFYALAGLILMILAMMTQDRWSVMNMVAVGLFCSTLWPCIFEIALRGMDAYAGMVSNLLIMMIMGGGWISVGQAWLSKPLGISGSYIVGVMCFAYLAFYGWKTYLSQKKQM